MDWSELERRQPALAGLGRRRLLDPGVVLVATIRADGTPRVSPVEPFSLDGSLWLSMLWHSRKAADLLRDPRILVHSVITSRDGGEGEFKVRGTPAPRATRMSRPATRLRSVPASAGLRSRAGSTCSPSSSPR